MSENWKAKLSEIRNKVQHTEPSKQTFKSPFSSLDARRDATKSPEKNISESIKPLERFGTLDPVKLRQEEEFSALLAERGKPSNREKLLEAEVVSLKAALVDAKSQGDIRMKCLEAEVDAMKTRLADEKLRRETLESENNNLKKTNNNTEEAMTYLGEDSCLSMNIEFSWLVYNIPENSSLWGNVIGATAYFKNKSSEVIRFIELHKRPRLVVTAIQQYSLESFLRLDPTVILSLDKENKLTAFITNAKNADHLKEQILLMNMLDKLYADAEAAHSFIQLELENIIKITDKAGIVFSTQIANPSTLASREAKDGFVNISLLLSSLNCELQFMKTIYENMEKIDEQANITSQKLMTIQESAESIRNIESQNSNLGGNLLGKVKIIESSSISSISEMWEHVENYINYYTNQSDLFIKKLQTFAESSIHEIPKPIWRAPWN
jgi:hypothetical protein